MLFGIRHDATAESITESKKFWLRDYCKHVTLNLDNQHTSDHVLLVCPECLNFHLDDVGSCKGKNQLFFSKYSFITGYFILNVCVSCGIAIL